MTKSQELQELQQLLERWKSHNEVHARPADHILYEFLKKLLRLGDDEEAATVIKNDSDESAASFESGNDDGGQGGNNPDVPPTP